MTFTSDRASDHPVWWRAFARWLYGLFGWKAVGHVPNIDKFVLIGAPHTSNWDGPLMVGTTIILGLKLQWLGKHTLFRFPFGWLMRLTGGVPVNRETTVNRVEQAVQVFNQHQRFIMLIAPEGTRSKSDHWKTGFYYIALKAGVPIVMGFVDYPSKRMGIGPVMHPSGDIEADFQVLKAFYADKRGLRPELASDISVPKR